MEGKPLAFRTEGLALPADVTLAPFYRVHNQRYAIYCQPCHDARGDGKGILFQRGKVPTTAVTDPKIVAYPDGQIFDVITNGLGLMPAYRWPITPQDRWAIVAHVRELQRRKQAAAQDSGTAGR